MRRAATLFLTGFLALAGAQTPPADLTKCSDAVADISIAACTGIIASPGQSDDTMAKAFTARGFSYLKKNQYDPAIEDFTQAVKLDPANAWALANRGNALFNKHEYERARKDYEAALKLNAVGYPTLFYGLGEIYRGMGEITRAIEYLSEAIRQKPDFPEALKSRGNAFLDNWQYGRAIEDYTQALELRPEYPSALQNRGIAYASRGDFDHAIADYDLIISKHPSAMALRNRGDAYRAKGDPAKALDDLNAAIRQESSTGALTARGDIYLDGGQTAKAFEDFDQAVRLHADDPDAWQSKARVEFSLGQWDAAAKDFQKSLTLDPSNAYAFIWLHLAKLRARQNDPEGELEKQAAQIKTDGWPAPLVDMIRGNLTPDLADAFASDSDPDKSKGQQCEARFYVGEYLLLQNKTEDAVEHLQDASRLCSRVFPEARAAKFELRRVGEGAR